LELERPVDRERSPEQVGDEGLDATLVLAQIAESEVKHDRDEQGCRGAKDDDDEAAN